MSKFSTLNYLINSYYAGKQEVEILNLHDSIEFEADFNQIGFEPSAKSLDAILKFASQYEVLKSRRTGDIELNLN